MNFAIIVASARARCGKTLLSRLLAEHFILGGRQPIIFESDVTAAPLTSFFPNDALALNIDRVTDQMTLFDGMATAGDDPRILDLANIAAKKFFDLMVESDFAREAKSNGLEPLIFYIAGPELDDFKRAAELRRQIGDCPFVLVENVFLGSSEQLLPGGDAYRWFADTESHMRIPPLDRFFMELLDEPGASIREFIREPTLKMAPETRTAIRSWLVKAMGEIHRVLSAVAQREPSPPASQ